MFSESTQVKERIINTITEQGEKMLTDSEWEKALANCKSIVMDSIPRGLQDNQHSETLSKYSKPKMVKVANSSFSGCFIDKPKQKLRSGVAFNDVVLGGGIPRERISHLGAPHTVPSWNRLLSFPKGITLSLEEPFSSDLAYAALRQRYHRVPTYSLDHIFYRELDVTKPRRPWRVVGSAVEKDAASILLKLKKSLQASVIVC